MVNSLHGQGIARLELTATWQATEWWKLQSSYTHLNFDIDPHPSDLFSTTMENLSPQNQFTLRSLMEITSTVEFDVHLYFMDDIPGHDLKRYTRLDVRFGWRPMSHLELALIGTNLLDNRHVELRPSVIKLKVVENEVRRSVLGKITWEF